jgi:hypothetical protein
MGDRLLAAPDPKNYRFAVFCCSYKWELGGTPDHALALFADRGMAERYGAEMWPSTFEVLDRFNQVETTD